MYCIRSWHFLGKPWKILIIIRTIYILPHPYICLIPIDNPEYVRPKGGSSYKPFYAVFISGHAAELNPSNCPVCVCTDLSIGLFYFRPCSWAQPLQLPCLFLHLSIDLFYFRPCSWVQPHPRNSHVCFRTRIGVPCWSTLIKITVNRRFDVSNIILKIEVVHANVKVVMRELKILNI